LRPEANGHGIVRRGTALHDGTTAARLLWLCCVPANIDCAVTNIPLGLPIPARADKFTDFGLLRAWLDWCNDHHTCNKHELGTDIELPTRLLYVGAVDKPDYNPNDLRLVLGAEAQAEEYIALSHRWGILSDEEKEKFCTSQDNIDQRMDGFSLSDLPKTFQDAVEATRQLHIPYLWIDSLCIIQLGDNNEDWQRESHRMETVFSAAYCVLAATSATDCKTGFLERTVTPESLYVRNAAGKQFYVSTNIDDFDKDIGDAELNNRAWVLQESVLARRTIHFTAKHTYFECGEGVYCENLTRLYSPLKKKYFKLDSRFPNRLFHAGPRETMEFIRILIEDYTKREITVETDRCVAMLGLQTRIASATGCNSRFGTFDRYIHRNLLWYAAVGAKLEKIDYTIYVPSWSWMAYNGAVRFLDEEISVGGVLWAEKLCFDEDRDCEHALIADVGKFQHCKMEKERNRFGVFDNRSGANRGWIRYDMEDAKTLLGEHSVVVGSTLDFEEFYILLVRPSGVDGEYKRTGIGKVQKNCLIRERANVRIV